MDLIGVPLVPKKMGTLIPQQEQTLREYRKMQEAFSNSDWA